MAQAEDQLSQAFICQKFGHHGAHVERLSMSGTGISRLLEVQTYRYRFVTCKSCGQSEVYDLRVLDGTDDVGTWLEILFSNQCGHLPALGSEGTMIEEKGMQITHQAPKVKTSVGLALSGGGARGLAHIGVLKVFEKAGIQIDCLAGSSMGGIIAAAYAAGWSPRALEQEALHMRSVRQLISLVDPRPPRRGLLAGNRVRAYLERLLGDDLSFSDLQLPLALMAVDLNSGRQVCLRQGKVLDAVLATAAFPGVFSPVEIDGATLVDGCVLDNLPVEMPREMGANVVIAVNVSPPLDEAEAPFELSILPGPAKEMYQVAMIMNAAMTGIHLKAAPPDVLISPDLPKGIGIFSGFTQADRIISAGEAAARRALPKLNQVLVGS